MKSEKIRRDHLERRAIIYVRQSTSDQVRHHLESRRRQYDLANRARELGWQDIEVIDEDLGKSAASAEGRYGFQRLVAGICFNEVGAVFCLEASRLARNNRDWYHLIDLCALTDTLLVDFDGIYSARLTNDRLLLGLKGTLSEFELAILRQRSVEALKEKARRGELLTTVPVGYLRTEKNRCEKDPDQRVQHAVGLVFSKFAQTGSVRQTLLWFRHERVQLPRQVFTEEGRGLEWCLPVYGSLHKMLTNPFYAGAYVYGRTSTKHLAVDGRATRKRGKPVPREDWEVFLLDHHPGYISWEEFERIQSAIHHNANYRGEQAQGAVRKGRALLAGLLRCGRCGRRLHVTYSGVGGRVPRYGCRGAMITHGEGSCISFGGLAIDRAIEREVLRLMEPAVLQAALQLAREEADQDGERRQAIELELQEARYALARARRQYDHVDPENRLVAAELERRWNDALARVAALETELERMPAASIEAERFRETDILRLADEFPNVWHSPTTDFALKKRLMRTLIEEILVNVDSGHAVIEAVVRWAGGIHTSLHIRKNRTGQHRYATDRATVDLVRELAKVAADKDITHILNRLRVKTGAGHTWTEARVRSFRNQHQIPAHNPVRREAEGWLTMEQTADLLGISPMSVRRLLQRGVIQGRQVVPYAPWVIQRADLAGSAVQAAVQAIKSGRRVSLLANEDQPKLDFEPTKEGRAL